MTIEELIHTGYAAEQCNYRRWDAGNECWVKGMNCAICSATCSARAADFAEMGKKRYEDKKHGMTYFQ